MLRNHLVISFRNIWRNKIFSFIHILGLSIGISASVVIFLIVNYELSFDHFEANGDRIYRVGLDMTFNGMAGSGSAMPGPLSAAIENEVTGVEANVPVMQFQGDTRVNVTVPVSAGVPPVFKKQSDIVFTRPDYFSIVPFEWIVGSPETSLQQPFNAVLSESRAHLYFPDTEPSSIIGRQLIYNDEVTVTVSGIVKDLKQTTVFTSREFISFSTIAKTGMQENFMMEIWDDGMAYSKEWVKLSEGNDKEGVERQLNALLAKYISGGNKDVNNQRIFVLQPLEEVHFDTKYAGYGERTANSKTLYGLLGIAGFLLILACINFVNLSTAQASQRAKEIGIRKSIGSSRKQLITQFLSETWMVTLLATIVSISIIPMLLQIFSNFIPEGVSFDLVGNPVVIVFIVALALVVSLLSGFYPAIVLSGFRPAAVLKNQSMSGSSTRTATMRKILTVSQFAVAQFFVIVAFMISKQIHFSMNQELGYRKDAILTFEVPRDTVASRIETIRNRVSAIASVEKVSVGFLSPATEGGAFGNLKFDNGTEILSPAAQIRWGDPQYLEVYNIALVAGRNIREGKDVNEMLINETYANELGFSEPSDALDKEIIQGNDKKTPIVGVMKDFHEGSTHRLIGPIVFTSGNRSRTFHVALDPGAVTSWQSAIAEMNKIVSEAYPNAEFEYKFYDDVIAGFYKSEQDTASLLNWAMGLSILISCLGLLGLVMYISSVRTKEIGIRKILGATTANIVSILSREFVALVLIAIVVAAPVAWYTVDSWLEKFAFRTEISWWVFAVSGIALIVVAMITLSFQTIRTASSNPADSLRSE